VNNGRDFAIEINNTDYVQTLKELLVQQMEYTVHPDDLKLILAKNDDDNWLQQNSGVVEALKRGVATNVVKKVLAKPQMIGSYEIRALGVPTEGSRGNIHVLVVVPPKEWGDVRPSKAREGEVQSTAELSQLLQLYGGFPSSLFVRQEVKMVWGILCNNYIGSSPPNNAYVLVGSPGVGKSALLVLFCCYLATHHDYNIYLARSLKHAGRTSSPHVLLCFRGKEVTAYPDCRPHHMEALWATFRTEHVHNLKFLIVGDGYRQANFESGQLDFFNTCNLLSTSAQYRLTEDSNHKLLGVPAWSFQSIQAMARAFGTLEVDELYAYSGGSVRAFTRDPFDLKMRTILQCNSVTAHTSVALRECISGLLDQGIDIMRRLFICNVNREESYVNPNRWLYCVDSTIVLKELAAKATLESFVMAFALPRIARTAPCIDKSSKRWSTS
ncbi:hypothetical protein AaE_007471, partial [Aphanomyces astaci]